MKEFSIPVYLINLACDHERRESSVEQLHELGINPRVITAYNGHQKDFPFFKYRHLSRGKWWNKSIFKPGAFACYLSHTKCWEKITAGNNPYGMILEDDMIINNESFKEFDIDNLDSFDIIFINFGVTRLLDLSSYNKNTLNLNFVPLNDLLIDLLINNEFNDNLSPGSYGYIVSKKGAAKLLQMTNREKICMGVDYAMVYNTLNDKSIETIQKLKTIPPTLQDYLDNINNKAFYSDNNRIILNSYICTSSPIISHEDEVPSTLKHKILIDFDVFNYQLWKQVNIFVKKTLSLLAFCNKTK